MYRHKEEPRSHTANAQSYANPQSPVPRPRSCAAAVILVALVSVFAAAPTSSAAQDSRAGLSFNAGPVGGSAGGGAALRLSWHRIRGQRAILGRYGTTFVGDSINDRSIRDASVMVGFAPRSSRTGRIVMAAGLAAVWGNHTTRTRYSCDSLLLMGTCVERTDSNIRLQPAFTLQAGLYQPFVRSMGVSIEATALAGRQGVLLGASVGLLFGNLM